MELALVVVEVGVEVEHMELEGGMVLVVHMEQEGHSLLVQGLEASNRLILQGVVHHFLHHLRPHLRLGLPLVALLQVAVVHQLIRKVMEL